MATNPVSAAPRRRRRVLEAVALGFGAVALASGGLLAAGVPGTSASATSTTAAPAAVTAHTSGYSHIVEVIMENLSYSSAIGYSGYQTLAHQYASASNSYAASHPSLPNYLDLTGGSTFGITSDCESCYINSGNLARQLALKHVTWGDFSEGVAGRCYLGPSSGEYAAKHNPFRYYTSIRSSRSLCSHLQPLTYFMGDLKKPASVPRFSFITPDLCNDGHDCSPSVAFSWLQGFIHSVTASSAWTNHGLIIVTWDEAADSDTSTILPSGAVQQSGGGGHVATLFIAPGVKGGTVITAPMTHESILASIESNFHLSYLRGAAAWANHTLTIL